MPWATDIVIPILRSAVRICLRNGLNARQLESLLRSIFVQESKRLLEAQGHTASPSRLSVITGIHRREVQNLIAAAETNLPVQRKESSRASVIQKVLGQWQHHKRFSKRPNQPRALSYGTMNSEFNALVDLVSKDVNPASVLFEMERLGAVRCADGLVELVKRTFDSSEDAKVGIAISAEDIDALTKAAEENLFMRSDIPCLHMHTQFDRIRASAIPEIRRWLLKQGHELNARTRDFLAEHDQDINPDTSYRGKLSKVRLGTFAHSEDYEEDS